MIKVTIGNNQGRVSQNFDPSTTIRECFETLGIEYDRGSVSLDGATLQKGDMDKQLSAFVSADHCYLFSTVKTQCASDEAAEVQVPSATAKIVGNMLLIQSGLKLDTIKKVVEYGKTDKDVADTLALFKGEGKEREEMFRVGVAPRGTGSASGNGVSFASATADGFAVLTMQIPDEVQGMDAAKKWVASKIGGAVMKLRNVEKQIAKSAKAIDNEQAEILASIETF